jgi:biotin/methionine sulfoxide reductase
VSDWAPHSAHWGAFFAAAQADGSVRVWPHPDDPDPNPLIENLTNALRHPVRVTQPMVRRGWLERGPGADDRRGDDEFVAVPWPKALDLVAAELRRVKDTHGAQAVFGGSYGWSSAGRFHHAQSQLHRFLNTSLGGYVRSVNNYSAGAAIPLLPHVLGPLEEVARRNVTWDQIAEHSDVVLAFGGMALKNSRVGSGGVSRHVERDAMTKAAQRGCAFWCISPIRSDLPEEARARWLSVVPGSDTALMLALVHQIVSDGRHDRDFLARCCDGWSTFEDYLSGRGDGVPKTCAWAAPICGVPEQQLVELARSLPGRRVLVVVSHSLQRSDHGEQPVWMGAVLAAVLGQLGLPGGGYNYALGTLGHYGRRDNLVQPAALPQGTNGVQAFIPVASIGEMLLKPGEPFDYNGQRLTYPHIRLAYWAGGNPFHHHQDLKRLARGVRGLDTFIVHESCWTATARHADIVLPATMTLEREDIGATTTDPLVIAMHRVAPPHGEARDDYDIFCELAGRLGALQAFSEGRTAREWLAHLYERTRSGLERAGCEAPDFESFWARGGLTVPQKEDDGGMLRAFRNDPAAHPLPTPSGKVQIASPVIAGFGYADCPGHPAWLAPRNPPDVRHPLWLVANQPHSRLHSQLDFGAHSASTKRHGREVCTIHPQDAHSRGIGEGDVVRLFNEIGACLAVAHLSDSIRPGVVQLPTGAWYDPVLDGQGRSMCAHGNPNALTRDLGTSSLAQGCTGQLTTIDVEPYRGPLSAIRAYTPPVPVRCTG